MASLRSVLIAAASLVLLAGCDDAETTPAGPTYADGLPAPPAEGQWIEVKPGGDTVCSRGTEYRFFVRGGDPNKVIVYFEGGGACWNSITCSIADSLFSDGIAEFDTFVGLVNDGVLGGFFDNSAGRQFADYTMVYVPYCTGDIHWGNATKQYTDDLTIEHKGFVNTQAALNWTYARYAAPQDVMVSGCSAGAYGAALHSAYIRQQWTTAQVAVLADSGAGIITEEFLANSLPNWNAETAIPSFIPALNRPLTELSLADMYIEIGKHFPDVRLAQTGAQYDQDQIFFFSAMGGDEPDWTPAYRGSLDRIAAEVPNFRYYVPPGSVHCVTPYTYFHSREVGGVGLADWTRDFVEADALPDNVSCEGAECCNDPVCDACAAQADGEKDVWCRFCDDWVPEWTTECNATPAP